MKEIKFRAWNKKMKIMMHHFTIDPTNRCINDYNRPKENIYRYPEDVNLMQFTGLKDKNGKDIYEGEIVKATFKGSFIAPIVFDAGCFKFDTVSNGSHPYILLKDWCSIDHKSCEVIGNIYENPELLGGK